MKKLFLSSFFVLLVFLLSGISFAQSSFDINGLELEVPSSNEFQVRDDVGHLIEDLIEEFHEEPSGFLNRLFNFFSQPSADQGSIDVVVMLAEPEDISSWAAKVSGLSSEEISKAQDFIRDYSISNSQVEELFYEYDAFNGFSASISPQAYEYLVNSPFVKSIHENMEVSTYLSDSVGIIGADSVWGLDFGGVSLTGEGQSVCVIDTGVDYTHPALGGCSDEQFLSGDCEKVIAGEDFITAQDTPRDVHGHGTHVAGIVAADGSLKGVAPSASIVAVKSLNDVGDGTYNSVLAGINYCINKADDYNITIISMSLGGGSYSSYCDVYENAINSAVAEGISVVAATGNDGLSNRVGAPACVQSTIRVGSTTKSDSISGFSNRWSRDMIVAPGTDILSTLPGGNAAALSGTSMATPHVSGAIALLNQYLDEKGEVMSPLQINSLLKESGITISDNLRSYKRINVYNAINFLETGELPENGEDDEPEPDPLNPVYVSISKSKSELEFGEDDLTISWSASSEDDISDVNFNIFDPLDVNIFSSSNQEGEVVLSVEEINHSGEYTISLFAESTEGAQNSTSVSFHVFKNNPDFELSIDGVEQDVSFNDSASVTVEGILNEGESALELFLDGSFIVSNESVIEEEFDLGVGNHEFSIRHNESENFNLLEKSRIVSVINSTPQIEDVSPPPGAVSSLRNESVVFSFSSFDNNDLSLSYYWFVDDELVFEGEDFVFESSSYSLGSYDVDLIVSNGFSNNSVSWVINLEPISLDVDLLSPLDGQVISDNRTFINFSVSNPIDVVDCWYYLNDEKFDLSGCSAFNKTLYNGDYYIQVFVNNSDGLNFSSDVHSFEVTNSSKKVPQFSLLFNGEGGDLRVNDSISLQVSSDSKSVESSLELFLNDDLVKTGEDIIFEKDLGLGVYDFLLRHNESANFEFKELSGKITVVNSTPQISSYRPSSLSLSKPRDESVIFSQESYDYNDADLDYYWFVNDELVSENNNFIFRALDFELGENVVKFVVSNGVNNNSVSWDVYLESAPIDVEIASIVDGRVYTSHEVLLRYSMSDSSSLDSCWAEVNGDIVDLPNCGTKRLNLPDGVYELKVFVNDTDGKNYSSDMKTFEVNVFDTLSLDIRSLDEGDIITSERILLTVSLSTEGSVNYSVNDGSEEVCFVDSERGSCFIDGLDDVMDIFVEAIFDWNNTLNKTVSITHAYSTSSGNGFGDDDEDEDVDDKDDKDDEEDSEDDEDKNGGDAEDDDEDDDDKEDDDVGDDEDEDKEDGVEKDDNDVEDDVRDDKGDEKDEETYEDDGDDLDDHFLEEEEDPLDMEEPISPEPRDEDPSIIQESSSGFFSGFTLIIFVVMILMLGVGGFYYYTNMSENTPANASSKNISQSSAKANPVNLVSNLKSHGVSDFEISKKLKESGFSNEEIVFALNNSSKQNRPSLNQANSSKKSSQRPVAMKNPSAVPVSARGLSGVAMELGVDYKTVLKLKKSLNQARTNNTSELSFRESLASMGWNDRQINIIMKKL